MNRHSQKNQKQETLLKATNRSLLISLPAMFMASVALAMPGMEADKQLPQVEPTNPGTLNVAPSNPSGTSTSPLNPRPSIFNEPPYNRSRQTSPPDSNTAPTLEPTPQGVTPTTPGNEPPSTPTTTPEPGSTLQPPLPEEQQAPKAVVTPIDGKVNIKLINATKAAVTYQVVGDTDQRTLTGDTDVTLQDITTPVTVTLVRQDGGLLKVSPQATSTGLLEVTLNETTSLDESDSTIRVQQNGVVLLN
jgi:hypothetical protein